jgi:hypothetical protein
VAAAAGEDGDVSDAERTLMRFAYCPHCEYRERLADDADRVPRMCNGCGHFGSYRLVGVTDPTIADALRGEFPDPVMQP